jgi:hypothetical protein
MPPVQPAEGRQPVVPVQIKDTPEAVVITSRLVELSISKKGVLVTVRQHDGGPLMQDASPPVSVAGGVEWTRVAPPGPFYGLGPRSDLELDLRGKQIDTDRAFLLTSGGYGEFHPGPGKFRFDFQPQGTYRITAPQIDYYFYYGPKFKQMFEHHHEARGSSPEWRVTGSAGSLAAGAPPSGVLPSWDTLRNSLLRMVHAAISAELDPWFDLMPYKDAPSDVAARARQIGSLVPKVSASGNGLSGFRQQLDSFFTAYVPDVEYHGYPTWHALPFQFPTDPECAHHADEFMLGDEMLVAPIYDSTGQRSLYLPQGVWTNLETNEELQGRRTITVKTASLPVFARNGTIVPLDSGGGMALHYFPSLGAEFFLLESDIAKYSQVHAAPAGDEMRLEIESAIDRNYEWVVHHVASPTAVGFADRRYRKLENPTL